MNDSEALRAIIVSTLLEILESPLDVRKMIKAIATFQPFLRFWGEDAEMGRRRCGN